MTNKQLAVINQQTLRAKALLAGECKYVVAAHHGIAVKFLSDWARSKGLPLCFHMGGECHAARELKRLAS